MIFILCIIDVHNRDQTKFEVNWSTRFLDIKFVITVIFIRKFQNVASALDFEVKY